MNLTDSFFKLGWRTFSHDENIVDWVRQSLSTARSSVADPANAHWFRYQNTWFAGVNVLGNDTRGTVPGGRPLGGKVIDYIGDRLGLVAIEWDAAQVSVIYPGYPKPADNESEAAYRYRLNRDAAHVDGIQRKGSERRRYLGEPHAFVLGIPMVETTPDAAPLVVWQGSHEIVRQTFIDVYSKHPVSQWQTIDVTEIYQAMRRRIFEDCTRVEIWTRPGEAFLIHRLALHGMAAWPNKSTVSADGRMICYFRPNILTPYEWLHDP